MYMLYMYHIHKDKGLAWKEFSKIDVAKKVIYIY